jgi:MFS family permease
MYVSVAIKNLALSMIGIFVPIYLFADLGYPLLKVLIFFLIYSTTMAVTAMLIPKFISKFGVKHGILLSMVLFIVQIVLLESLHYHELFYLPAIVWGVANAIYWLSFHTDFVKNSDKKNRSQEVSLWFIMAYFGLLIGPILGSVIITYLGFLTLFIISILLLLLSAVPLFLTPDLHEPVTFSYKNIFKGYSVRETTGYMLYGIRVILTTFALPLFIFMALGKYLELGGIASLAALVSMGLGYFIGKTTRTEKKEKLFFKYGALFHSVGLFFILLMKTFIQLATTSVYLALSFLFVEIPHHSRMYSKAKKTHNVIGFITYREVAISLGRIIGVLIVIGFGSLEPLFIAAGIGMIIWAFL